MKSVEVERATKDAKNCVKKKGDRKSRGSVYAALQVEPEVVQRATIYLFLLDFKKHRQRKRERHCVIIWKVSADAHEKKEKEKEKKDEDGERYKVKESLLDG